MKRVGFHTLGCKLNFAETLTIGRQFVEHDFRVVDFHEPADVYVLNTCSVTERADREARQIIRRALRTSPDACIVVVGCYAQLEPEEVASIDGVDIVLGTKEKFKLFEVVTDFCKKPYPQIFVSDIKDAIEFHPAFSADNDGRTRAFMKIQDGCDYHCAFCTIPLARGESRSQSFEAVIQQAKLLVRQGYKEIVLTGVNVGDYGTKTNINLLRLLHALENIDDIERIRISSIEPNLLTMEIVDLILRSKKICNHFHIPLQSGSDNILKRMRRRYLTKQYRELLEYITMKDPDAAIGADVIVGFPGETDALFEETYLFLVDLPVSYLHVFTYSERENTPAAQFNGVVEPKVRFTRSRMLRILSRKKRRAFSSRFIGRTMDVLFEGDGSGLTMSGLTTNYVRVHARTNSAFVNHIVPVHLKGVHEDECEGEPKIEELFGHDDSRGERFIHPNEAVIR